MEMAISEQIVSNGIRKAFFLVFLLELLLFQF